MPILRVVGQLAATYIIAEGPDGMYLIDQHAAHERVLYEQMLSEHTANRLAVQPLLEPVVLDLSAEQAAVAAEELPDPGAPGPRTRTVRWQLLPAAHRAGHPRGLAASPSAR